jgi:hypothetical protein
MWKKFIDHLKKIKKIKNNSSSQKTEKVRTDMQYVTDHDVAQTNQIDVNVKVDMQAHAFEACAIIPQLICQRKSMDFLDKEMRNISK